MIEGIVIGAVGGALAGLTVWLADWLHKTFQLSSHRDRVHKWLDANTPDENGNGFRTTRTIASYNNLTEDRVRFVCSHDPRIVMSTGKVEDLWGIKARVR